MEIQENLTIAKPKAGKVLKICRAKDLPVPNHYVLELLGNLSHWAYDEERVQALKGRWRSQVFLAPPEKPLDLEIGTGNGFFFSHQAKTHSDRLLVGLEIKFKPLIQSIRRALNEKCENMRIARYHGSLIHQIFEPREIDNVFIYFPDPWPRKRSAKHRLIQDEFLLKMYECQKPGSFIEFKTDSEMYYEWALERFQRSQYQIVRETRDLHQSQWNSENFQTHFEKLWTAQGLKTFYLRAVKVP